MSPLGHLGIVLLAFAPIGRALVVREREGALAAGVAAAALLALAPDADLYVAAFAHRGLTHTLLAALVLGGLSGLVCCASGLRALGTRAERTGFGFLVGTVSVGSHLLGDVITPMGVRPFLPLDGTTYTLSLVYARNPVANRALFAGGVLVFGATVLLTRASLPAEDVADDAAVDAAVTSD